MSYEGYEQHICQNGHYFETDCSYFSNSELCPWCQATSAFINSVDCTNGDNDGIILDSVWDEFLICPAVKQTCNLGHEHIVRQATYRIPTQEELKKIRVYGGGS